MDVLRRLILMIILYGKIWIARLVGLRRFMLIGYRWNGNMMIMIRLIVNILLLT